MVKAERLEPLLKWAGGKEKELKYILPALPRHTERYFEPFVGGGAVYFAIQCREKFINDKSEELVRLYEAVAQSNGTFLSALNAMADHWRGIEQLLDHNLLYLSRLYEGFYTESIHLDELIDSLKILIAKQKKILGKILACPFDLRLKKFQNELVKQLKSKMSRMKKLERQKGRLPVEDLAKNFLSAIKSAYYTHIRHLYNHAAQYEFDTDLTLALFYFIRSYAYSGMFRYNKNGEFNVPYGGIGYNRKYIDRKLRYFDSTPLKRHLGETTIENLDFEMFFDKHAPRYQDFVFLDPPYDSEFSTYAKNQFTKDDQQRLAHYLIHHCQARWMLVIKHTDFIFSLYNHSRIYIQSFDKCYQVNFMDRNNRQTKHLLITNYEI